MAPQGRNRVLCLIWKLFSKSRSGRNNNSSRRRAKAGCALRSQMKASVSIAAVEPTGSNVPVLIHICGAVNICVSSPGRAGAPGNQKASVATAKTDCTPREVWLSRLKCLKHLLFTTSWPRYLCKSASGGAEHKPCQAPEGWSRGPREIPHQSIILEQSPRHSIIFTPGRMPYQLTRQSLPM